LDRLLDDECYDGLAHEQVVAKRESGYVPKISQQTKGETDGHRVSNKPTRKGKHPR